MKLSCAGIKRRIKSIYNRRLKRSLITVVVPIYNGEKTIGECLDALLSQTQKRIKVICVNDGSTDKTLKILKKYRIRSWKIRIINQENSGRAAARNAGLRVAKTKYVMFCDDDDKYDMNMCELMLNAIEDSSADLAICGIKMAYEVHSEMKKSDDEYYRLKFSGKKDISDDIVLQTDVSVCNKIFRTDIIRENNIRFPDGLNNEDFFFCNAYMSVAKTIYFLDRKLYNYIRRKGSIMSDAFDKKTFSIDHLLVAEQLFYFYRKNGFLEDHKDLFWRQWIASFWFSYEHSKKEYIDTVNEEAGVFLDKNFERYLPSEKELIKMKGDIEKTINNKEVR